MVFASGGLSLLQFPAALSVSLRRSFALTLSAALVKASGGLPLVLLRVCGLASGASGRAVLADRLGNRVRGFVLHSVLQIPAGTTGQRPLFLLSRGFFVCYGRHLL